MSWVSISAAPRKASQVKLSLWVRGSGSATMSVSWASTMAAKLGFEAADFAEVLMGEGEDQGKMLLRPAAQGLKLARMKHSVRVSFPPPKGVTLKANAASLDYALDQGGFVIALPGWARPGVYAPSAAKPETPIEAEKPGSLALNGNTLVLGAKQAALTGQQAKIVSLLIKNFGKPVRRQQIADELYSLDPNGGGSDKNVDVQMVAIRQKIESAKMDLMIKTHRQFGFEMCRPVAG